MLEIKNIRNNKDEIILNLSKRKVNNIKSIINDLIKLDDKRKKIKSLYDNLNSGYEILCNLIGINIKNGNTSEIENLKKQNSEIKEEIKNSSND